MATHSPGARRGRPPALTRAQIVESARELGADVTVMALAQRLGVDRKTITHHVTDLRGLRELVASDVFHEALELSELDSAADWRESVAILGRILRDGFLRAGTLAEHVGPSWVTGPETLEASERFLEGLRDAGFSNDDGVRILVLLTGMAYSSARDRTLAMTGNARVSEVEAVLRRTAPDALPAVRHAIALRAQGPDDQQFEFELRVLLEGLAAQLPSQ